MGRARRAIDRRPLAAVRASARPAIQARHRCARVCPDRRGILATEEILAKARSQIDRLGERLRKGPLVEDDLRALDEYRASFVVPYHTIFDAIRRELAISATGRFKTTPSIIDELRRESVRLSQIQDIAGCRIVVPDIEAQEIALDRLTSVISPSSIVDRRLKPSHGYRAVHIIAEADEFAVEVQLRTWYQHSWAEISEKLSDRFGLEVKYGGGDLEIQLFLDAVSDLTAEIENQQLDRSILLKRANLIRLHGQESNALQFVDEQLAQLERSIARLERRYDEAVVNFMIDLD